MEDVSKEKSDFIQSCCENIVWSLIRPKLTATFFEHQPIEWFKEFFDYISRDYWNVDSYKTLPIFIDNRNKAVSAFDEKGNHILYLPDDGYSTSSTINPSLLQFASVKKIVAHWNIVKESRLSIVKRIIREDLANGDANLYAKGFVEVLRFCNSCSDDDLRRIGDAFKESPALYVCNLVDNKREREKADDCYYPTEDLCLYFKGCESIAFVDVAYLKELAGNENHAALEKLFSILAIRKVPKCFTELKQFDIVQLYGKTKKWHYSYKQGYERWEDFYIHKSKHFFESFDSETDGDLKKKMSVVLWKFLCQIICQTVSGHSHIEDKLKGVHHYYYDRRWQIEEYETILHRLLRNSVWLFDNRGNLTPHSDLFVETLSNEYEVRSSQAKQLLELLGIEHNERLRALNTLSDEERADLSAAKEIRDCGFGSLEEVKAILTNVPDKVRRKISAGELSAAKILEAVNLLERTEAEGHNLVVQERKEMSPQHMKMLGQDGNVREVDDVVGTVMSVSVADGQYAGLSKDAQANVLHEAKELVKGELEQQGYEFTNGICEDKCSIIDGVQKHGIDYPLVVHSYLDDTRQFQLNAADWAQLMKPNSMLWVRTRKGVCSIPFRELVSNRERIELSFSTSNLEIGDRIDALASVLRWFTRLHFDFGKLIPSCVGVIQAFDLPEKAIPRDKKESELSEDPEEGVL